MVETAGPGFSIEIKYQRMGIHNRLLCKMKLGENRSQINHLTFSKNLFKVFFNKLKIIHTHPISLSLTHTLTLAHLVLFNTLSLAVNLNNMPLCFYLKRIVQE